MLLSKIQVCFTTLWPPKATFLDNGMLFHQCLLGKKSSEKEETINMSSTIFNCRQDYYSTTCTCICSCFSEDYLVQGHWWESTPFSKNISFGCQMVKNLEQSSTPPQLRIQYLDEHMLMCSSKYCIRDVDKYLVHPRLQSWQGQNVCNSSWKMEFSSQGVSLKQQITRKPYGQHIDIKILPKAF